MYGYEIAESRIGYGKGTKQILYLVQFKSKDICKDLLKDMSYNTTKKVKLPKQWFEFSKKDMSRIARNLFDADGGCSLRISYPKRKKCFEIEREIFLGCSNQKLRNQYKKFLAKIGIRTGESSNKLTITNRKMIQKFIDLIDFSENVLIGYDSKHWQGLEKRKLLRIIIDTYSIPWGHIQNFNNKEEIYNFWPNTR